MPADWDEREKIPDPMASKPEDWDEDAPRQILDESAEKPDGWLDDEPDMIPDPDATMPDDWDAEMDGDWEAPLIDNPECASAAGCGPWEQPMIDNPNYKGITIKGRVNHQLPIIFCIIELKTVIGKSIIELNIDSFTFIVSRSLCIMRL